MADDATLVDSSMDMELNISGDQTFDLASLFQNGQMLAGALTNAPVSATQFEPFQPMKPSYAPSGYGRQILIYDSRAHPGRRREFAYKTRFTNQSGLTTVYYRCMACRALRHRLQRCLPKENLPAVPCIAVKNELLINDPDFPEASDHFCTPLTIAESDARLKMTFERGYKRARMKMAAEESMKKQRTDGVMNEGIDTTPIMDPQWEYWRRGLNSIVKEPICVKEEIMIKEEMDESAQSTSSNENKDAASETGSSNHANGSANHSAHSATPTASPIRLFDDTDLLDGDQSTPRGQLDALLRLQEQRSLQAERDKSHSPDENLNCFTQKLFEPANDFAALFGGLLGFPAAGAMPPAAPATPPTSLTASNPTATATATVTATVGSELAKALTKVNGRGGYVSGEIRSTHMSDFMDKFLKNNRQLPEDATSARSSAELTCSMILALSRNLPQAVAAMKQSKNQKLSFVGDDVYGKTLGLVGLGKVGFEVAQRMHSFGMKVVAFHPHTSQSEAEKKHIKLVSTLEDLWPQCDYVSFHFPQIPHSPAFLDRDAFAKCKQGIKVVNISQNGLVNEAHLLDALVSGRCGGAAIDVLSDENRTNRPMIRSLTNHPKVICTPHLNASTIESQQRAAMEQLAADNIMSLSNSGSLFFNASAVAAVLSDTKLQYVKAVTNLGQMLAALHPQSKTILLKYPAGANSLLDSLQSGVIVGLLNGRNSSEVTHMNAEAKARQEGITIKMEQSNGNELVLSAETVSVTGCPSPAGTLIFEVNSQKLQTPVIADGVMAVAFDSNSISIPEKMKSKVNAEYGFVGATGRLALLRDLSDEEITELEEKYSVIKF